MRLWRQKDKAYVEFKILLSPTQHWGIFHHYSWWNLTVRRRHSITSCFFANHNTELQASKRIKPCKSSEVLDFAELVWKTLNLDSVSFWSSWRNYSFGCFHWELELKANYSSLIATDRKTFSFFTHSSLLLYF